MAVARLSKIKVLIHRSLVDVLIGFLQRGGSMEIINLRSRLAEEEYSLSFKGPLEAKEAKGLTKEAEEVLWLIDFMSLVDKKRRYTVTAEELEGRGERFDYRPLFERARRAEASLKELESSKDARAEERERLLPWLLLGVDLKDVCRTGHTIRGLGVVRGESFVRFKEGLEESGLDVYLEEASRSDNSVRIFYICLKAREKELAELFKRFGIEHVHFPDYKGRPAQILVSIENKMREIEVKKERLLSEVSEIARHKKEAFILFDRMANLTKRLDAATNVITTEAVCLVEGWVRKREAPALKEAVERGFGEAEVFIEEPEAGEDIPVLLENHKLVQPFELITKIYGMPAYNEVDPTPFLAPFFFVFFGFCLSDAGYGAVLSLFSLWALKRFRMGWTGNRFFRLLLYGGISTILLGAFTGGWFGNIVDMLAGTNRAFWHLKRLKDAAVLLDPMKEPMRLLVAALSLGLIQIWFGHIVAIYGNIKNRRYLDALLDQGSILLFLFGFTGAILIFLSALPKGASSIFTPPFAAGAVAIALTSGRANPGLVPKLGYGLFNLYSVFSGYISDLLSYSRLWALGLVTGVMGATFNLMGAIIGGMVPGVGFVVTAFIIFAGHTMSILMNLLGAFIHPMRLQFVEFFSKFFRGGGRDFKPLALENRFTVVE